MTERKRKGKSDPDRKVRFCDPGACDSCRHIGGGDFLCERHQKTVVSGWENTEHYMICKRRKVRNAE